MMKPSSRALNRGAEKRPLLAAAFSLFGELSPAAIS
jgi:hypothetical protein